MSGSSGGFGRRKFDAVPTVPLDALLDLGSAGIPVEKPSEENQKGPKGGKAVTHGLCPMHVQRSPIALVWDGPHLAWREHTYRTWTGTPFTCGGSLQRLCEHPSRWMPGEETPRCPCQQTRQPLPGSPS